MNIKIVIRVKKVISFLLSSIAVIAFLYFWVKGGLSQYILEHILILEPDASWWRKLIVVISPFIMMAIIYSISEALFRMLLKIPEDKVDNSSSK